MSSASRAPGRSSSVQARRLLPARSIAGFCRLLAHSMYGARAWAMSGPGPGGGFAHSFRVEEVDRHARREEQGPDGRPPRIGKDGARHGGRGGGHEERRDERVTGRAEGPGLAATERYPAAEDEDGGARQAEEDPVPENNRIHEVREGPRQHED